MKFDSIKNSNINFLSKLAKLSNFTFNDYEQTKEELNSTINELNGQDELLNTNLKNKSSKMKEGLLLVQELLKYNKKVLVWTVHLSTMFAFEKLLKSNGINVRIIYGSTDSEVRNEIIDDFNYGGLDVLITNPQTLSESVSLHYSCHDAIYLEQPLNLSQYLQSRDRIHRLGIDETQETNYYFLFNYSDNYSLDNRIYDLLKFKEEQMYKAIKDNSLLVDETFDENELKSLL
jgi:SNF2 family DNA or RNA helicase